MLIADLITAIESIAPPTLAESWDNVGLLLGDRHADLVGSVLLTIDLDDAVLKEAIEQRASAIIAYHPPIFSAFKRLTADTPQGKLLLSAIQRGIAIYSPHTALDACAGGVCDWLLELCAGGTAITSRSSLTSPAAPSQLKLVTFVPTEPADVLTRVRSALANAGAGHIGHYDQCSFTLTGTGSFRGDDTTNPAVGQRGKLESVNEHRLEMVLPARALPDVIAALRRAHPYEEPAFDIYPLHTQARTDVGAGRVGTLKSPTSVRGIVETLRKAWPHAVVQFASADEHRPLSRIAVCPGSGASLLDAAIDHGAEVFITGEMKHHEVRGALDEGMSIIVAGHTETERGYLPVLASRLASTLPNVAFNVSKADRPPMRT